MDRPTIQQAFDLAVQHHRAGRSREAERLYREILVQQPDHAEAIHLLGVIAHQAGQYDLAADSIRRAIALRPNFAQAYNNLGIVLKEKGQLDDAVAACRQAIELMPGFIEAHHNLGVALHASGQLDGAIASYRQVIALNPNFPKAHSNLGNALKDKGQFDEAIAAHRKAIAVDPTYAEAYHNLGMILETQGNLDEAIAAFREAIALKPTLADTHNNLGIALNKRGRRDEAIAAYRQAVAIKPDYAEAHNNLGVALREAGRIDEAIGACRRAIVLRPGYAEAHSNLGIALRHQGHLDEARAACEQAVALDSKLPEPYLNLGNILKDQGHLDESIAAFREAVLLRPSYSEAHSNLIYTLNYHPAYDAQRIAGEHRDWNCQHAERLRDARSTPFGSALQGRRRDEPASPGSERRLRIGYVSPDFREHAVCRFFIPLMERHDGNEFEIFCYSSVQRPDAMTARVQSLATAWRNILGVSDERAAECVREDKIDIMVDLAGHTAHNRLLVFARAPAPIQVTYLGYPATTGLDAIDYRLTDAHADPHGAADSHCTEKLVRLSESAWCYQPPSGAPPVNALPALQNDRITFGCFANFTKINEPMLHCWAEVLRQTPNSRLFLKAIALQSESSRHEIRRIMFQDGISADRLDLRAWAPVADHLGQYHQVDIALDTFPYHGTATTCEALWMGAPVVTLAGKSHVSRVGVSLLSNVGSPEWIGSNMDEYVRIATGLANDRPRLSAIRAALRSRMCDSPLMDASTFARNIEAAYREMWRTRLRK